MGLFRRKGTPAAVSPPPTSGKQYPDELADEAEACAAAGDWASALEKYVVAVDKLHTMYTIAEPGGRIRTVARTGTPATGNSAAYLRQIAAEAGDQAELYWQLIWAIEGSSQ